MTGHLPLDCLVSPDAAGSRIDLFISRSCPGSVSRAQAQKLINVGAVSVNGCTVLKSYHVLPGDRIVVESFAAIETAPLLEPQDIPLSILFEDEFLIAINKPAGLVVHPGVGNRSGTLVNALLFAAPGRLSEGQSPDRPGIVHRLDKETSGIIVVAKTNQVHAKLAEAFASRQIAKTYYGFCMGKPREPEGIIEFPLGKSRSNPMKRTRVEEGKPSRTDYAMLAYESGISFIRFLPRTGRTHQIRAHCSGRGFPIVADDLYGGGEGRLMRIEPGDRHFARSVLSSFSRHALHAHSIEFKHPFSGETLSITAPFPADFENAKKLFKDGVPEVIFNRLSYQR